MTSNEVERILESYLERELAGNAEPVEELISRFPQHAHVLRRRLARLSELSAFLPVELSSRRFGDFEVESELGRGGMGIVYRARRLSDGAIVAVKVLARGALFDETKRARFEREVHLLSRFRHPGIVPFIDSGEVDGQPWLAMELVHGSPLAWQLPEPDTELDETRVEQLLELAVTLAESLSYAHSLGVVHRDLKPHNIVLREDGSPVILDFGLASAVDLHDLTRTGESIGTTAYMAPEQAFGRAADARADVYGLAATLLHLLGGKVPFQADGLPALVAEMRRRYSGLHAEHEQPRSRALRAVLRCALAIDPRDRYGTIDDFAADLRRVRDGLRVRPRPRHPVRWARAYVRGSPARALAVVASSTVLLISARAASTGWVEARERALRLYEQELERCSALLDDVSSIEGGQLRAADDGGRESPAVGARLRIPVDLQADLESLIRQRPADARPRIELAMAELRPWLHGSIGPRVPAIESLRRARAALGPLVRDGGETPSLRALSALSGPAAESATSFAEWAALGSRELETADAGATEDLEAQARVWNLLGRSQHALELLMDRHGSAPCDPVVARLLGRYGRRVADVRAYAAAHAVARAEPDSAGAWSTLALCENELAKRAVPGATRAQALEHARLAMRLLEPDALIHLRASIDVAVVLSEAGGREEVLEAIRRYEALLEKIPGLPIAAQNLIFCLDRLDDKGRSLGFDDARMVELLRMLDGTYDTSYWYWGKLAVRCAAVESAKGMSQADCLRLQNSILEEGFRRIRPWEAFELHCEIAINHGDVAKAYQSDPAAAERARTAAREAFVAALDALATDPPDHLDQYESDSLKLGYLAARDEGLAQRLIDWLSAWEAADKELPPSAKATLAALKSNPVAWK